MNHPITINLTAAERDYCLALSTPINLWRKNTR